MNSYAIGQLARAAGVGIDTVRYYERSGLLEPAQRLASGYRRYGETELRRLHFIRRAQRLGFSLAEIKDLLAISGRRDVRAVRLQELFGLAATPRIAGGRLGLKLHLLSPARRPVQVTQDLASFWANTYLEVKKDLKGRYPKHYWPDDPLIAEPTARVKPRK